MPHFAVAMESHWQERRRLGALSYFVIRDEPDAPSSAAAFLVVDVAEHLVIFILVPVFVGAMIGILVAGLPNRWHVLASIVTPAATSTAGGALVVATTFTNQVSAFP
ncbi:hypothetical protein GCM10009541_56280 [Micromonospora gifhornensis]|uniref:Uncharacterized protein n=1 Tax=Micromonospora gifhornensis TaxID=84594 RepID=A0ABQ4ILX9_9ACTN|nr:hypothetical protein [Micromonospora gifhornensis]GIJ18830.1 hypothetical protein Vgi01_55140 [Micromonospora gifhornensis]